MVAGDQVALEDEPEPVLDEDLARRTTRFLGGKLEAVAVLVQATTIFVTAQVDQVTPEGRTVLLGLSVAHAVVGIAIFKVGGPFRHGGPFLVIWLGMALVMPLLMAHVLVAGEYGASPACVQVCGYPAPAVALFAFYPWLSLRLDYLRPGLDILFLAAIILAPLLVMWRIYGFVTPTNLLAVGGSAVLIISAYVVGKALGQMCWAAARDKIQTIRAEYDSIFNYLHSQVEGTLSATMTYYSADQEALVLKSLQELGETVNRQRTRLLLTQDMVSVATLLNLHARRVWDLVSVELPNVSGISLPRSIAWDVNRALGELLKNIVEHSRATTAQIGLELDSLANHIELRLTVQDDGIGLAPAEFDRPDTSLASLRRAARARGGELRLLTGDGPGTRLEFSLLIDRASFGWQHAGTPR